MHCTCLCVCYPRGQRNNTHEFPTVVYHEAVHNTTCAYVFETEKGRPLLKDNRERWNLKPFPILFNVRRQENQEYLNKKTPQIIKRENKIIV